MWFVIVYNKLINNLFLNCACVYKCCSVLNTDFYLVFLTLCWKIFYLCVIIKKHFKIMKHFISEIFIMYITVLSSVFKLNKLNHVQRIEDKHPHPQPKKRTFWSVKTRFLFWIKWWSQGCHWQDSFIFRKKTQISWNVKVCAFYA
jgi:hypothetical protein